MKLTKFTMVLTLFLSLFLQTVAVAETDRGDPTPMIPYSVTHTMVWIPNGDHQIPATLTLPKELSFNIPAIVMLHGTASSRDEVGEQYKNLATELAEQGIGSIRIDFAGTGDSKQDYIDYTVSGAVSDADAAFNYLKKSNAIDIKNIGIIGYSQGGLIAILAASKNPEIKAMVTWSSAIGGDYRVMLTEEQYKEAQKNGYALVTFDWRSSLKFSLKWMDEFNGASGLTSIKEYTGAYLALAGFDDKVVPWQNAQKLVESAGSQDAVFTILKGADHVYRVFDNAPVSKEVRVKTVDFFVEKLIKNGTIN